MKLTWISEYEAHPGEMIEWRLHPASIATAVGLAADAQPPSYMQAGHIKTAAKYSCKGSHETITRADASPEQLR